MSLFSASLPGTATHTIPPERSQLRASKLNGVNCSLLLGPCPPLPPCPFSCRICVVFAGPASVLSSSLLLTWLLISQTQQTQRARMELTPFSLPIICLLLLKICRDLWHLFPSHCLRPFSVILTKYLILDYLFTEIGCHVVQAGIELLILLSLLLKGWGYRQVFTMPGETG